MNKNTEHGGVFFYIILAIVLLAGLTYVVSQNNRGNTDLLTDEQARVTATEIIDYGNTVAKAVQKLRLRGCGINEISAQRDWNNNGTIQDTAADAYIALAPDNKSCHIFDINGGNINYHSFDDAEVSIISGQHRIENIGCNDPNSSCSELFWALRNIPQNLCIKINDQLGIKAMGQDTSGSFGFSLYNSFPAGGGTPIGDSDPNLTGKTIACYQDTDDVEYHFYQVLIAR